MPSLRQMGSVRRRVWLQQAGLASVSAVAGWSAPVAQSATHATAQRVALDAAQSRAFRAWFCAVVQDQVTRAPTPRWTHRDCAGLVRFAAREALVAHNARWFKAMGWPPERPWPPDVQPRPEQAQLGRQWAQSDGSAEAFASALALVQNNTRPLGKDAAAVQSADLLFFDQGAEQHLMVWTGKTIAYHNGSEPTAQDNGLRSTTLGALLRHPDTRWRPVADNPNFAGWYRLAFLTR